MYTFISGIIIVIIISSSHMYRGMQNIGNQTLLLTISPNHIESEMNFYIISFACNFFRIHLKQFALFYPSTTRMTLLWFYSAPQLTTRVQRSELERRRISVNGTALIVIEVRGKAIPRAGGRSETAFSSWRGEGIT